MLNSHTISASLEQTHVLRQIFHPSYELAKTSPFVILPQIFH